MFSELMDEAYSPNEIDDELFLSEVPLNLLEKSIKSQFDDPEEYRKIDYVQSYLNRYEFSIENSYEDDEEELEELRTQFVRFMRDIFKEYLGIGFPTLNDLSIEDQHELIHNTYNFFIHNMKKNFVTLLVNYVKKHEEELTSVLPRKKDVASLNFKDEIENDYDVLILSNIGTVFDLIIDEDLTAEEFLSLCIGESNCLETEYVIEKYRSFEINGNFVEKYIAMISDLFRIEIETKFRNKILLKYPKRQRKNIKETMKKRGVNKEDDIKNDNPESEGN